MACGQKWQGLAACTVSAPIDKIWEVAEFGGLSRWDPDSIESSDIVCGDGYSEGSTRCVVFRYSDGSEGSLYERLLSYDPSDYMYSYTIDENPFGYEGYIATFELEDNGDGTTHVSWSFEVDPMEDASDEDTVVQTIEDIFHRRLSLLESSV